MASDGEAQLLARFADRLAELDDPVRAGRALGLGPVKSGAMLRALRRRMGDQAR